MELLHKPGLNAVLTRLSHLHARQAMDQVFAVVDVPNPALVEFGQRYSDGFCDYPDPAERVAFWDKLLAYRSAVEDDSVPCAYLSEMDQGLYGGILGGSVQFMAHPDNGWISSMVPPLLTEWSQLDGLRFDPASRWFQQYLRQLDAFAAGSRGRFGVSHFILIDSLNFAFELMGATKTYLALDEHPDVLRRVIELAFDLNVKVQEAFFAAIPLIRGGTASNMVQWAPGRIVSESVDPFHMTSVACFEQWGRGPVERIYAHFDGGVVHIHGNGRHLLEAVSTLRGLRAMYLGDDRGFPLAFDVLPTLRARTRDVPLVLACPYDAFCDKLARHELTGGVLYKVHAAPDIASANRLMGKVREYRV